MTAGSGASPARDGDTIRADIAAERDWQAEWSQAVADVKAHRRRGLPDVLHDFERNDRRARLAGDVPWLLAEVTRLRDELEQVKRRG